MPFAASKEEQVSSVKHYYSFQSKIYDTTRWTFLFGRDAIIEAIPLPVQGNYTILEIGCGTGRNLDKLARRFPQAQLIGIDISADMLLKAAKSLNWCTNRLTLIESPYEAGKVPPGSCDVILFSYALSMINPQWLELVNQAIIDLKAGGYLAVVDFHDTTVNAYRKFMESNHVKVEGQLLNPLQALLITEKVEVNSAYLGLWRYFLYVGRKG
jgi:S-adenosylmethionine-diacylgycerolhomoserine-N-methlytransferase